MAITDGRGHYVPLKVNVSLTMETLSMLTELQLKCFKSWKSIDRMRLAPITGLFGTNSSGKSSILQLLLMLKQTVESADRRQILNFGDERSLVNMGTFRDVVHEHMSPGKLDWRLSWTLPKELKVSDPEERASTLFSGKQISFEANVMEAESAELVVDRLTYHFGGHVFGMKRSSESETIYDLFSIPERPFHFKRTRGRPWSLPSPVKCYGFPDQVKAFFQNAGFLADLELAFEQLFSNLFYLGPLREYPKRQYTWGGAQPADMGPRGERVVDALLASRQRRDRIRRGRGQKSLTLEEQVAWWLRELRLIHDFAVEAISEDSSLYRVLVRKSRNSARVLITDVGFGVSQILPVLALCYYVPEGSIILLEQPEIHLHPSVQAGLADVFIDATKHRKVQIIVESHSEHLLRRLQRRIAEGVFASNNAALYFSEMVAGKSKLTALDIDLFGNITNWPQDFFGDDFGEIAAMSEAQMRRRMKGA
jgi:predicted ATPase